MAHPDRHKWDLTEGSFGRLLAFLDPDRQRAGERYEKIRAKLTRFFEWKGCLPGEDYADETIDRVAKRLEQGIESEPQDPYLFFHGVAVNVVRERWRKLGREPQSLDALSSTETPRATGLEFQRLGEHEQSIEQQLSCLHDCLDRLTPASRELLTRYHLREQRGQSKIGVRRGLAEHLSIPAGALRLRVYRIRRQMERCLHACLARTETVRGKTH